MSLLALQVAQIPVNRLLEQVYRILSMQFHFPFWTNMQFERGGSRVACKASRFGQCYPEEATRPKRLLPQDGPSDSGQTDLNTPRKPFVYPFTGCREKNLLKR
jgi:hypothetical protein